MGDATALLASAVSLSQIASYSNRMPVYSCNFALCSVFHTKTHTLHINRRAEIVISLFDSGVVSSCFFQQPEITSPFVIFMVLLLLTPFSFFYLSSPHLPTTIFMCSPCPQGGKVVISMLIQQPVPLLRLVKQLFPPLIIWWSDNTRTQRMPLMCRCVGVHVCRCVCVCMRISV